jgi:hypothetical protein
VAATGQIQLTVVTDFVIRGLSPALIPSRPVQPWVDMAPAVVVKEVDDHRRQARVIFGGLVLTARLSGRQVMINGHALSPPLSFMAAVPVGPEPRSLAGGRLERLETAITVTECD